jgi:hypothetical protein
MHEFTPPVKFIRRSRPCESATEDIPKAIIAFKCSAENVPPSSCLDRSRYNRLVGEKIHEELECHRDLLYSELDVVSWFSFEEPWLSAMIEE